MQLIIDIISVESSKNYTAHIYYIIINMIKTLRYIAIIIVSLTVLFFWYKRYSAKQAEKLYVDLTKTTIITQLEVLNKLETASMTMQKTIVWKQWLKDLIPNKTRDNVVQNFLFEDTIEMIATAKITAGFDLATMNTWSITVHEDKSVTIVLPKAQILSYSLTPETKPFLRKRWVLNPWDIQMETEVRNQALEKMKQESIDKWILVNAEKNATDAFKNIVWSFGIRLNKVLIQ